MKFNRLTTPLGIAMVISVCACSGPGYVARNVKLMVESSDTLSKYQVGFSLYDPGQKKTIYAKDEHKYFTPASNTKLYTFYASLKMLPEYVPALKYVSRADSTVFWGTGDPSFLQGVLKGTQAFDFLKGRPGKLFYSPGRYTSSFYGAGWQWDDYNGSYQPEVNELPIMDNMITVTNSSGTLTVTPPFFNPNLKKDTTLTGAFNVVRQFDANDFTIPATALPPRFRQQVPYKVTVNTTLSVLSDTLKREIGLLKLAIPPNARVVRGMARDSILKEMMLPSDNFIAEHLLLLCADQMGAELNTGKVIAHVIKTYMQGLPDKPVWVDGSGLSRYNLFTPASNVKLLELIMQEFKDPEMLFTLFPAGGVRGTLKNAYPATNKPFVFAKTGSLSNNHNQSGYIKTRSGKLLIYSFMNNNFTLPTAEVRKQMARIVTYIHEKY